MSTQCRYVYWRQIATLVLPLASAVCVAAELGIAVVNGAPDWTVVAINKGDAVRWTLVSGGPSTIGSYGSVWGTASLTNTGDSFAFTFTNVGFFAYQTTWGNGTISVLPWTNVPPRVTINFPVEGFIFGGSYPINVGVSMAPDLVGIAKVEFFAGADLIGAMPNQPYSFQWSNMPPGEVEIVARATDTNHVVYSSQSVHIARQSSVGIFGPRLLPGGQFFCYCVPPVIIWPPTYMLVADDSVGNRFCTAIPLHGSVLFIDERPARKIGRFYQVTVAEGIPPPCSQCQ